MGLTGWIRRLFRSDPQKRAAADLSREDRHRAAREIESAKAEVEAVRQFRPPMPPGGFGH
jgi:hypothetical protein